MNGDETEEENRVYRREQVHTSWSCALGSHWIIGRKVKNTSKKIMCVRFFSPAHMKSGLVSMAPNESIPVMKGLFSLSKPAITGSQKYGPKRLQERTNARGLITTVTSARTGRSRDHHIENNMLMHGRRPTLSIKSKKPCAQRPWGAYPAPPSICTSCA